MIRMLAHRALLALTLLFAAPGLSAELAVLTGGTAELAPFEALLTEVVTGDARFVVIRQGGEPFAAGVAAKVEGVLWLSGSASGPKLSLLWIGASRVIEADLPPIGDAAPALTEALRLRLAFLLETPREQGQPYDRPIPLPPALPALPTSLLADFELTPAPPWPRRPPVALPPPRQRLGISAPPTELEVVHVRDEPEPEHSRSRTVAEAIKVSEEAPAEAPQDNHLRFWSGAALVVDGYAHRPALGLGMALALGDAYWLHANAQVETFEEAGLGEVDTLPTRVRLSVDLCRRRSWRWVSLCPRAGLRWETLRVERGRAEPANRLGVGAGLSATVPLSGPLSLSAMVDLGLFPAEQRVLVGESVVERYGVLEGAMGLFLAWALSEAPTAPTYRAPREENQVDD